MTNGRWTLRADRQGKVMKAITTLDLQQMKASKQKIVMVTAYDYTMARLVDAAGIDMVLVGDSLGMVVQGHDDTLSGHNGRHDLSWPMCL